MFIFQLRAHFNLFLVASLLVSWSSFAFESFPLTQLPEIEPPLSAPRSQPPTPEERHRRAVRKQMVLTDAQDRISEEFSVPPLLAERVSFWFDIYTVYGEAHHIIHHARYPWLIYRVYDARAIINNGKGPLWLRRKRATDGANREMAKIRRALLRLSKRKSFRHMNNMEVALNKLLSVVPGRRQKVFREAAENIRSQLGQKDFFVSGLQVSTRYLPHMESEFRARQLPTELTRLPFVESSFNTKAYSKVGASGIWQIMPETGKSYLRVDSDVDERNSPLKATAAAARILRSYARQFGSWPLAVTAYNNGSGNLQKALKAAQSRDLGVVIERYHRGEFKFASSNFFACFLAALHAEKYQDALFPNLLREPKQRHEMIRLGRSMRAARVVKMSNVDRSTLLDFNPDLNRAVRKNVRLPRGLKIYVPDKNRDQSVGERLLAPSKSSVRRRG
ncbi:MAG: lytic transglycosylase domain-containing protein [Bdellovibrionales bacterium]